MPDFQALDTAARERVATHEPRLRAAYRRALARVGAMMAQRLESAAPILADAQGWRVPDPDALATLDEIVVELHRATDGERRGALRAHAESLLREYGIRFDITNPLLSGVFETLGRNITRIADDHRAAIMREVQAAWDAGDSIPNTAKRIRVASASMSTRRAVTIARTEIVGAANGASLATANMTGQEWKQWMTAPGAETPRHVLYANLNGQTRRIDQAFDVGGHDLRYPGDQYGPAHEVVNCRCVLVYPPTSAGHDYLPNPLLASSQEDAMPRTIRLRAVGRITDIHRNLAAAADGATDAPGRVAWSGTLMFVDTMNDNRHEYARDGFGHRDLPIPLMAMFEDDHGTGAGANSFNAGQIATMTLDGTAVRATGTFGDDEQAQYAVAKVESGDQVGVSVDVIAEEWVVRVPAARDITDAELEAMFGENPTAVEIPGSVDEDPSVLFTRYQVAAATLVPIPAAAGAEIAITASAAGLAPMEPPRDWFYAQEANGPVALTVTDEGHVYGHAWLWESCHTGFQDRCVTAPREAADYALFHLKTVRCADGSDVPVGTITLGKGHASTRVSVQRAMEHYDDTRCAAADVRVTAGKHGGWVSGAIRPTMDAAKVRELRGATLSGDWRYDTRAGERKLIGLAAVNVPGFPVPRTEALVAAVDGHEQAMALVAAGIVDADACAPCDIAGRVALARLDGLDAALGRMG